MSMYMFSRLDRSLSGAPEVLPPKVLQVGEGNFIRAFADWMFHKCNEQGLFRGGVIVSPPRISGSGKLELLQEQDGLFTLMIRGLSGGEKTEFNEVVSSIAGTADLFKDWARFLSLAENPDLEFVVSNTTEAGIAYVKQEYSAEGPYVTYPARLTAYMFRRYGHLGEDYGVFVIPCELLERAGDRLQSIVIQHARDWNLDEGFIRWIQERNTFVNTLVDRIVTGYPAGSPEECAIALGYEDKMAVVAEPYYEWVIEDRNGLSARLPFREAGLNVRWVDDLSPYEKRKVRILNGAHTFLVPMAYLKGYDIVRDAVSDESIAAKVGTFLHNTVLPVLPFNEEETKDYIASVLDRFRNPYIDHRLLDIALNGVSKSVVRLQSTLLDYFALKRSVPEALMESYAHLLRFYRVAEENGKWYGYRRLEDRKEFFEVKDAVKALAAFSENWARYDADHDVRALVENTFRSEAIWDRPMSQTGIDFAAFTEGVAIFLEAILQEEQNDGGRKIV
jgi:tagaturonate reductase